MDRGVIMTKEQIKEQLIDYAKNNLDNEAILEAILELLNDIINEICYDYPTESNILTTCYLEIKQRVLKNDNL